MEIYQKIDFDTIIDDLQKKLRIQDWDLFVHFCTKVEMVETAKCEMTDLGYCVRTRSRRIAHIYINTENNENNDGPGLLRTLIHEMVHVVTDDYFYNIQCCGDYIEESIRDTMLDNSNILYERMVEDIAKGIFNSLNGDDYIEKHLRSEGNGETKTAI